MSIARKRYLVNNKKHPWQTREYGKSIPCEFLKNILKEKQIQFIEEYQPLLHKERFFSIDIAFPDKKIGLEVNGGQHYDTNGNLKLYYQNRHNLIEQEGWKLYEIPYSKVFNIDLINSIIQQILNSESKLNFDYFNYTPKQKNKYKYKYKYIAIRPNNFKYNYPPIDKLKELALTKYLRDLSKELNIPSKTLWSYLNGKGIHTKRDKPKIKIKKSIIDPNWRHRPQPNLRKVERPSKEELETLVQKLPIIQIGKLFKVSGNSIIKWMKIYKISKLYGRGYWAKKYAGKII